MDGLFAKRTPTVSLNHIITCARQNVYYLNVKLNKEGNYENVEDIIRDAVAYDAETFEMVANEIDSVILDVRHQDDYAKGHIPKSIFIGIDGDFAPLGWRINSRYQAAFAFNNAIRQGRGKYNASGKSGL